jgi:hypothetical protein
MAANERDKDQQGNQDRDQNIDVEKPGKGGDQDRGQQEGQRGNPERDPQRDRQRDQGGGGARP